MSTVAQFRQQPVLPKKSFGSPNGGKSAVSPKKKVFHQGGDHHEDARKDGVVDF